MGRVITICLVCLICVIGLLVAYYMGGMHFLNDDLSSQKTELKALRLQNAIEVEKTRREEIITQRQQAVIDYNLKQAETRREKIIDESQAVLLAHKAQSIVIALWPVWILSTLGIVAVTQRHRLSKQVVYADNGIETIIPAKASIAMLMRAYEVRERQAETQAQLDIAELSRKALESGAKAAKAFAPYMQQQEAETIEMLPAFTGDVHFSQAVLDGDYSERNILLGRNTETGAIAQIDLEELQSFCKNGLQKSGKTVLTLAEIHNALCRKYVLQEDIKVYLIDIHGGYKDALSTRLENFLPGILSLFDGVFLSEDDIETGLVDFLDGLILSGKAARNGQRTGLTCVYFDEYTETVANLDAGKDIEQRVKRLFNYRKAGILLSLVMFEGGKNTNSSRGLNVSKMAVSRALFHTAKEEGARFLPGGNMAAGLDKGEYLLLLPGMAEPERIKAALLSAQDFAIFSQFVHADASQAHSDTNEGEHGETTEGEFWTAERVRAEREKNGLSQGVLAEKIGLTQKEISRLELGKKEITVDIRHALDSVFFVQKLSNVILFPGSSNTTK